MNDACSGHDLIGRLGRVRWLYCNISNALGARVRERARLRVMGFDNEKHCSAAHASFAGHEQPRSEDVQISKAHSSSASAGSGSHSRARQCDCYQLVSASVIVITQLTTR